MDQQRTRSFAILAAVQAALGGLIAVAIGVAYLLSPTSLRDVTLTQVMAGLGVASVAYFGTIHQLLKKSRLGISALIISLITCLNLLLVIIATGGLDSPFYSFWLLVLVAAGMFGHVSAITALSVTLAGFLYALGLEGFDRDYLMTKFPQLLITLAASGLAEWVYLRGRRAIGHAQSLTGQLGAEQLKAQALMDNMADGVVAVDHELNIQLFNHAAQLMTGWDEDSARDINYRTVMGMRTADDNELTDQTDPFLEAWNSRTPVVKNNLAMTTRAGRKVALTMSISPIFDTAGQPNGGIAVFRDISKEKEMERQRDEFISTASHEMRTPVAAIEGYIALAMNPKSAMVDERAMAYLAKAHDNVKHLGQLFKDLLSATKMDEGRVSKNLQPVNLSQLVQDAVGDMQTVAAAKGLSLTFTGSANVPGKSITPIYMVMGDPERLREVTMNLIDNATKYTSQGGITVGITGDDKTVVVSVGDTGIGIAQEDIPHLFQKFYRIDSTATRTIGGTGLGLYLCRSIIELHQGRIWVESTLGKGSTFYYSLPRVANQAATEAPVSPAAPAAVAPATAPAATPVPAATGAPTQPDAATLVAAEPASVLVEATPPTQTPV